MKISVESLSSRIIPHLRIRSLGLGLYTVEAILDDGWAVLCDDSGEVLQFTGMEWVRRRLAHLKVRKATLIHSSPYNEMIGLEQQAQAPIEVPVSWNGKLH